MLKHNITDQYVLALVSMLGCAGWSLVVLLHDRWLSLVSACCCIGGGPPCRGGWVLPLFNLVFRLFKLLA